MGKLLYAMLAIYMAVLAFSIAAGVDVSLWQIIVLLLMMATAGGQWRKDRRAAEIRNTRWGVHE